jgi:23S rRNA pseudouridine2605 synthase
MATERVQKILAGAGVASRRAAERLITDGRVRVNGKIVKELGTKADAVRDRIEVDGKRVVAEHPVYYLLHKPREVITTLADPEERESVADLMKRVPERVFPVGRLDYHTSGALLMTNDGDLAQALLHPRKKVPKVYVAKVKGALSLMDLQLLRQGVVLDGGEKTAEAEVFVVREERGNTWLQLTITEGKNRQVHRMGEAIGHRVMRLFRLSFAGISVDGLRVGEHRPLGESELAKLKRDYLAPSKRDSFEQTRARRLQRLQGTDSAADARVERRDTPRVEPRDTPNKKAGRPPRTYRTRFTRATPAPTRAKPEHGKPQPVHGKPQPNQAKVEPSDVAPARMRRGSKRPEPVRAKPEPTRERAGRAKRGRQGPLKPPRKRAFKTS